MKILNLVLTVHPTMSLPLRQAYASNCARQTYVSTVLEGESVRDVSDESESSSDKSDFY
jgi:hypothetical protein